MLLSRSVSEGTTHQVPRIATFGNRRLGDGAAGSTGGPLATPPGPYMLKLFRECCHAMPQARSARWRRRGQAMVKSLKWRWVGKPYMATHGGLMEFESRLDFIVLLGFSQLFCFCFEETGLSGFPDCLSGFPDCYWAFSAMDWAFSVMDWTFPIAIGRSRLRIGRSRPWIGRSRCLMHA